MKSELSPSSIFSKLDMFIVSDGEICCCNLAAQLMAVPAIGALALGAGAVVASVGSLVLPFYAGYKLHKRLERRRSAKRRHRAREAMWRKLEDMRWRGRPRRQFYYDNSTVR